MNLLNKNFSTYKFCQICKLSKLPLLNRKVGFFFFCMQTLTENIWWNHSPPAPFSQSVNQLMYSNSTLFRPRVYAQWLSMLRWLWEKIPWWVACQLIFSWWVPTQCLNNTVSPLWLSWGQRCMCDLGRRKKTYGGPGLKLGRIIPLPIGGPPRPLILLQQQATIQTTRATLCSSAQLLRSAT